MLDAGLFVDQDALYPFELELAALALAYRVGDVVLNFVQLLARERFAAFVLHVLIK